MTQVSNPRNTGGRSQFSHVQADAGRLTRQTDFRATSKGHLTHTTLNRYCKVANQTTVFEPELQVKQNDGFIKTQVQFGNAKEFKAYCKEIQGNNFKSIINLKAIHYNNLPAFTKPPLIVAANSRVQNYRGGNQTEHHRSQVQMSNCGGRQN